MNFFDWTYGTKADSAIVQDVSLEEHDRRFHPNGYKEGDICSLRDTANKEDTLPIDNGSSEKAVSLLRNWLPNVKIVEDDSADTLQRSLMDSVRKEVRDEDYVRWQGIMDKFVNKTLIHEQPVKDKFGRRVIDRFGKQVMKHVFWPVVTSIPEPIKDCYRRIGFEADRLKAIGTSVYALEHTTSEFNHFQPREDRPDSCHKVSVEDWRKMPLYLDSPAAIFRSNSEPLGVTALCPIMDDKTGTWSIVAVNYRAPDRRSPNYDPNSDYLIIGSVHGRDAFKDVQFWIKKGLLMYVDESQLQKLAQLPGFGDTDLAKMAGKPFTKITTESGTSFKAFVDPGWTNKPDKREQALTNGHGFIYPNKNTHYAVKTPKDFLGMKLGFATSMPDEERSEVYDRLRYNGDFQSMRSLLDEEAKRKGFVSDEKTDSYVGKTVDGKTIHKSAELQEWDGSGNAIPLTERFDRNKSDRRYKILRRGDEPIGWYNRTTGEVHLVKGKADAETVAHELGWHASFHSAEKNDPALYKQMMDYAKTAPVGIKEAVLATYGNDLTEEELLDEIGAKRFTEENLDVITDAMAKQEANGWFGKVKDGVKRVWSGFIARIGGNRFGSSQISAMSPEEGMRILAKAMASGKTLTTEPLGEKRTE